MNWAFLQRKMLRFFHQLLRAAVFQLVRPLKSSTIISSMLCWEMFLYGRLLYLWQCNEDTRKFIFILETTKPTIRCICNDATLYHAKYPYFIAHYWHVYNTLYPPTLYYKYTNGKMNAVLKTNWVKNAFVVSSKWISLDRTT